MLEPPELKVARVAAERAAAILHKYFRKSQVIDFKSDWNLVSQADRESEACIVDVIGSSFPDHQVLGEEAAAGDTAAEHLWIVDPLDGTNNFCHGIDHFAISIGYYRDQHPQLGVVYRPCSDEWYIAIKGQGAFHNGRRCRVADHQELNQSLFGVGFFYDRGRQMRATLAALEDLFCRQIHGVRRMGTASLDLCMVGTGSLGGYFEFQLAPWDYAAGKLFVEEAGGRVTTCRGSDFRLGYSSIVAACPGLHVKLLDVVTPHYLALDDEAID